MLNRIYLKILNEQQKDTWPKLFFLKEIKAYLAGGTALALRLGHRTSVDFDFYTAEHFTAGALIKIFKKNFNKITIIQDINDTFEAILNNKINISLFYYDYKLLMNPLKLNNILIASCEDIAAMKLIAISQRGKRRDFIDIYYLLKIFTLKQILMFTEKKYNTFDIYHGLRGLLYFKDADDDIEINRIKIFDKKLSWKKIKREIETKVRKFQKVLN